MEKNVMRQNKIVTDGSNRKMKYEILCLTADSNESYLYMMFNQNIFRR